MQCLVANRRFSGKGITLADLWQDMTITEIKAYRCANGGNKGRTYVANQSSGLYYIFSFCDVYCSIWRLVDGSIYGTPIKQISSLYGNILYQSSNDRIYYNDTFVSSSTSQGTQRYASTVMLAQFPNYTQKEIEKVFSKAALAVLSGRDNYTNGYVRTDDTSYDYYIVAVRKSTGTSQADGNIGIGTFDGTTFTKLAGTTTDGVKVNSGYLYGADLASQISGGGTIVGIK